MQFGVSMFPADYAMSVVDLARAVEERGFESLFFPEHTHIPVSRCSPFPSGGELSSRYYHALTPSSPSVASPQSPAGSSSAPVSVS